MLGILEVGGRQEFITSQLSTSTDDSALSFSPISAATLHRAAGGGGVTYLGLRHHPSACGAAAAHVPQQPAFALSLRPPQSLQQSAGPHVGSLHRQPVEHRVLRGVSFTSILMGHGLGYAPLTKGSRAIVDSASNRGSGTIPQERDSSPFML